MNQSGPRCRSFTPPLSQGGRGGLNALHTRTSILRIHLAVPLPTPARRILPFLPYFFWWLPSADLCVARSLQRVAPSSRVGLDRLAVIGPHKINLGGVLTMSIHFLCPHESRVCDARLLNTHSKVLCPCLNQPRFPLGFHRWAADLHSAYRSRSKRHRRQMDVWVAG